MLVSLRKEDLIQYCFNNDVEKFLADREKNHHKRKFFLPGIRKTIFSNFEVMFGVAETQLLENFTVEGRKVDKRFLQRRVSHAVDAFFLTKVVPNEYKIGEFEKIADEGKLKDQVKSR